MILVIVVKCFCILTNSLRNYTHQHDLPHIYPTKQLFQKLTFNSIHTISKSLVNGMICIDKKLSIVGS